MTFGFQPVDGFKEPGHDITEADVANKVKWRKSRAGMENQGLKSVAGYLMKLMGKSWFTRSLGTKVVVQFDASPICPWHRRSGPVA